MQLRDYIRALHLNFNLVRRPIMLLTNHNSDYDADYKMPLDCVNSLDWLTLAEREAHAYVYSANRVLEFILRNMIGCS